MKGHWVFNSTITLSKQEQTEIRKHQVFQNIKNKVMAKAEQFLIVFCLWQSWALVVPPPPVCCCKHPAFFQTNHFQIQVFEKRKQNAKHRVRLQTRLLLFPLRSLNVPGNTFKKSRIPFISALCSIYLNPHKHLFSCTHTEEPKYYNHTHTHSTGYSKSIAKKYEERSAL